MKRITNLTTHGQDFILASTQPEDAFSKLGKYVAINAEHITDGATNRRLTGLDVITAETLPELMQNCDRFARHVEYMKTHPMPPPPTTPEEKATFEAWMRADFQAWSAGVITA